MIDCDADEDDSNPFHDCDRGQEAGPALATVNVGLADAAPAGGPPVQRAPLVADADHPMRLHMKNIFSPNASCMPSWLRASPVTALERARPSALVARLAVEAHAAPRGGHRVHAQVAQSCLAHRLLLLGDQVEHVAQLGLRAGQRAAALEQEEERADHATVTSAAHLSETSTQISATLSVLLLTMLPLRPMRSTQEVLLVRRDQQQRQGRASARLEAFGCDFCRRAHQQAA